MKWHWATVKVNSEWLKTKRVHKERQKINANDAYVWHQHYFAFQSYVCYVVSHVCVYCVCDWCSIKFDPSGRNNYSDKVWLTIQTLELYPSHQVLFIHAFPRLFCLCCLFFSLFFLFTSRFLSTSSTDPIFCYRKRELEVGKSRFLSSPLISLPFQHIEADFCVYPSTFVLHWFFPFGRMVIQRVFSTIPTMFGQIEIFKMFHVKYCNSKYYV